MGLWPLLSLATGSAQLALAVGVVRLLLAPTQQRPEGPLFTALEETLHAWEAGHPERMRSLLQYAISLAQDIGYL